MRGFFALVMLLLIAAGIWYFMNGGNFPLTLPSQTASNTQTTPPVTPPATPPAPPAQPPAAQPAQPPAPEQTTDNSNPPPAEQPAQPPAPPPVLCDANPADPAQSFTASAPDAYYCSSGHLVPGSGNGDAETNDWAPGMRFPIDQAPAYANSQVWGVGGTSGPAGGQGDVRNYSYPWHDDFCESRSYATSMCPSGKGHQGQDIRPAKCCGSNGHLLQDTFVVDAAEDGQITSIGTYTVYLTADSGRLYRYLHMDMKKLKVKDGDRVTRGQALGYLSNSFGSSVTTFHLHFEIKTAVNQNGSTVYTWVSPYPSLVASYANLLAGHP